MECPFKRAVRRSGKSAGIRTRRNDEPRFYRGKSGDAGCQERPSRELC